MVLSSACLSSQIAAVTNVVQPKSTGIGVVGVVAFVWPAYQ